MLGKSPNQDQSSIFNPLLKDFINMNNPLVILSDKIPWKNLEKEFEDIVAALEQRDEETTARLLVEHTKLFVEHIRSQLTF